MLCNVNDWFENLTFELFHKKYYIPDMESGDGTEGVSSEGKKKRRKSKQKSERPTEKL